jgi:hypothetical protein
MAFTLSGQTIIQSGTDTSLAWLSAIAGVVTRTAGDHKTYFLDSLQISVDGNLTINPEVEQLSFGASHPSNYAIAVGVSGTGTLTVGTRVTVNGEFTYSDGTWLRVVQKNTPWNAQGSLLVLNGGTFNWHGGSIDTASSVGFQGGTVNITRGEIFLRASGSSQPARCLCDSNTQITNVTLHNNGFGPSSGFTGSFSNCKVIDGAVIGMHGSVLNLTISDYDYEARGSILTTAANSKWVSKNTVRGTAAQNGHNVQPARLLFTKDVSFTVRDLNNAVVPNAVIYSKEYLGQNRPAANFIAGDDFTTPQSQAVATNSSGVASFSGWRLGVTYRNAVNYFQSFWTKNNDSTDVQDFYVWSYGHLPQTVNVSLKGAGTQTVTPTLLPDLNVTLTETAAVAKLASSFVVASASNLITVTAASTLDDLYDVLKAWKTRTVAAQLEYPTISTQPVVANGDTLVTSMIVSGIHFLTAGAKFKKINALNHLAAGVIQNISIIGNVTQLLPYGLSGVSITGELIYNAASAAWINFTNTQIGTVSNEEEGIITITRDATSFITDYSDPQINYLDSTISAVGITSATIYQTAAHRDANTNAGATFTSSQAFKYGGVLSGVTMSGPVYLRVVVGSVTLLAEINLAIGDNLLDLGTQGQLSAISAKIDSRPTLPQIEASTTLAKEATTVALGASLTSMRDDIITNTITAVDQGYKNTTINLTAARDAINANVDQIPTNPVLTTDVRLLALNRLDATISSRLSSDEYVVPPSISDLVTTAQLSSAKIQIIADIINKLNTDHIPVSATDIAVAVESALLNDLDGQALLDAIANNIGNQNIDQIALVAALRTELERTGGTSQLIKTKVDTLTTPDISALATASQLTTAKTEIVSAIGVTQTSTAPTAAQNAAAVRKNLAAELARISTANQILLTDVYIPTPAPSVIIPSPSVSAETTKVYAYTETITNQVLAGIEISFELVVKPSKSERILETTKVTMVTNSLGYAEIDLQRDKTYLVTASRLSLCKKFTPKEGLFDLSTLIQRIVPF